MKKINVFDFDKTVYQKDSTIEFWKFCIKYKKKLIFLIPYQGFYFLLNKIGAISIERCKEKFFIFLKFFSKQELENLLINFWRNEIFNLNKELVDLIKKDRNLSVCISASPKFLIENPCKKIGIDICIGTEYNLAKYKILGKNCKGKEKINKLNLCLENYQIENFYSDSLSDLPLFNISENKFLLKNKKIFKF